ncbi:MAG: class I SAM-dependent methyltransferase [Crocosphaera sp.]|nr:class I SAM-dependent methyltransferase [Crocosphaera sp.]
MHKEPHGSILDIGCGTGLLKDFLRGDFHYTGVDVANNMLDYALLRGYTVKHKSFEEAIPEISYSSYDFVFALGCLLFIEDIHSTLRHINRIARQGIILSLDQLTQEYINKFKVRVYDHSTVIIPEAKEDYFIRGWTSPTIGMTINTRIIYIPSSKTNDEGESL